MKTIIKFIVFNVFFGTESHRSHDTNTNASRVRVCGRKVNV